MINKLGFGFLRLPKKDGELDWQTICSMVDVFMGGAVCSLTPAIPIWMV